MKISMVQLKWVMIVVLMVAIYKCSFQVEKFSYLYGKIANEGKDQYEFVHQRPSFDKDGEFKKDKKMVLSLCQMGKNEMKRITKDLLGSVNRYEYHYSGDGMNCGQKLVNDSWALSKNQCDGKSYDLIFLNQCQHMNSLKAEFGGEGGDQFTVLKLSTIKNASKLLNKNGLLVIKVDKPVNVVAEDGSLIYVEEKTMGFMRRYNFEVYDINVPYFVFKKAFEFINEEPKLSDSVLVEDQYHKSIV